MLVVGAALLARSAISPMAGLDTYFRWDFLAQKLFELGRFDFYPPLTPADFRTYFYVDGIPPIVSFAYWWLYAAAGRHWQPLISLFGAAQFACTLAFTYGTAKELYSRRAGWLAAAALAGSPLYFRSVVLGQETGLTALSIAATLYFVAIGSRKGDSGPIISAGLAAALCALSREYGWIAVVAGVIALLWRRHPLKHAAVFAAVATAVAAPWYLRSWILTGNPFYSLSLGNFAINPVHAALLRHYQDVLGVQYWTSTIWTNFWRYLLVMAPVPVVAGLAGALLRFRRDGYLVIIGLLLFAIYLQSVGYTSGGATASTRVLSPVLVVLCLLGAGLFEPLTRRMQWHAAATGILVVCQLWTAAHGAFYPTDPLDVPAGQWRQAAFQEIPPPTEFQIRDQLVRVLPGGARVMSDNAYLHASLMERGIEVVPVWSPEVRFIFSSPPDEAEARLKSLGIGSVAYYPKSLNTEYLVNASPFYGSLPQRWHLVADAVGFLQIFVPGER